MCHTAIIHDNDLEQVLGVVNASGTVSTIDHMYLLLLILFIPWFLRCHSKSNQMK